jgi:hypothetical protein
MLALWWWWWLTCVHAMHEGSFPKLFKDAFHIETVLSDEMLKVGYRDMKNTRF